MFLKVTFDELLVIQDQVSRYPASSAAAGLAGLNENWLLY